jgi:hypothetical protein
VTTDDPYSGVEWAYEEVKKAVEAGDLATAKEYLDIMEDERFKLAIQGLRMDRLPTPEEQAANFARWESFGRRLEVHMKLYPDQTHCTFEEVWAIPDPEFD